MTGSSKVKSPGRGVAAGRGDDELDAVQRDLQRVIARAKAAAATTKSGNVSTEAKAAVAAAARRGL